MKHKFKPGQRVRVTRRFPGYTGGWEYPWVSGMDASVGKVFTVGVSQQPPKCGVRLLGTGRYNGAHDFPGRASPVDDCYYPPQVLELVKRKRRKRKPVTKRKAKRVR